MVRDMHVNRRRSVTFRGNRDEPRRCDPRVRRGAGAEVERNRLNFRRVAPAERSTTEDTRPMDLKLTTRTQEAMAAAVRRAATDGHPQVEPAHLLAALLDQADGVAPALITALGAGAPALKAAADRSLAALPSASGSSVSSPALGRHAYQALSAAGEIARELGDEYVSTEHLLIGLASGGRDAQTEPGAVAGALTKAGATREALLAALPGVRGSSKVTSPDPEGTYNALAKYGNDLTALARDGKLDPVIGRDAEIRRVVQVLSRRTKNNPV